MKQLSLFISLCFFFSTSLLQAQESSGGSGGSGGSSDSYSSGSSGSSSGGGGVGIVVSENQKEKTKKK
jgi:uncharacterized membrane protein YgcG